MQKIKEKLVHCYSLSKQRILSHKAISLIILIVLVIFGIFVSRDCRHEGRFGEGCFPRGGMFREGFGPLPGGPIGPGGPGDDKRLFDHFCQSGQMGDAKGFMNTFRPGVQKRDQGVNVVKAHLQNVVAGLKAKGYDTSNLENQMQAVDQIWADFDSGSQNLQADPQSFCDKHSGRVEMNTKIKSIMTGIFEEIQRAEQGTVAK